MISVIIPVYKVEKYLDKCVESVVGQTYTDLEIILVDDGSPDGCPAMCDAWAEKDERIKAIHKPNGGLSSARNAGLVKASGEYVFFLDSDDTISANCIELLADAVRRDNSDICIANVARIDENGKPIKALLFDSDMLLSKDDVFEDIAPKGLFAYVISCGRLYRRNLFDGISFLRADSTRMRSCITASLTGAAAFPSERMPCIFISAGRGVSCLNIRRADSMFSKPLPLRRSSFRIAALIKRWRPCANMPMMRRSILFSPTVSA